MKKIIRIKFGLSLGFLTVFALWTIAVSLVDVQTIGPENACVGFATLNGFISRLIGVNWILYILTDWLALIPLVFTLGFAILGLVQWIRRKSLSKVDSSILALGGFYIVVIAAYVFFEFCVVNYRPVLINGIMEASYPSSTTLLVLTVMPTACMQFNMRINSYAAKRHIQFAIVAFTVFMVVGRLLSGVHWMTDIIGGALLSAGLVMLYDSILTYIQQRIR